MLSYIKNSKIQDTKSNPYNNIGSIYELQTNVLIPIQLKKYSVYCFLKKLAFHKFGPMQKHLSKQMMLETKSTQLSLNSVSMCKYSTFVQEYRLTSKQKKFTNIIFWNKIYCINIALLVKNNYLEILMLAQIEVTVKTIV